MERMERIINIIGCIMLVPGPILLFWNMGALAQGATASIPLLVVGLLMTVAGLVMGNFKAEWLEEE